MNFITACKGCGSVKYLDYLIERCSNCGSRFIEQMTQTQLEDRLIEHRMKKVSHYGKTKSFTIKQVQDQQVAEQLDETIELGNKIIKDIINDQK